MTDVFLKLPKKLKVGTYTFNIKIVPATDPDLDGNDGMTLFHKFEILFDEELHSQRAHVVVLHEVIHAINFVYGIEDGSTEEHVTTQLSTGFAGFMKDNPKLFQWISANIRRQKRDGAVQN